MIQNTAAAYQGMTRNTKKLDTTAEKAEDNTNAFLELLCLLVQNGAITADQCNALHNMNGPLRVYPFDGGAGFIQSKGKFDDMSNIVYI